MFDPQHEALINDDIDDSLWGGNRIGAAAYRPRGLELLGVDVAGRYDRRLRVVSSLFGSAEVRSLLDPALPHLGGRQRVVHRRRPMM
jgi:hypothetical protein